MHRGWICARCVCVCMCLCVTERIHKHVSMYLYPHIPACSLYTHTVRLNVSNFNVFGGIVNFSYLLASGILNERYTVVIVAIKGW